MSRRISTLGPDEAANLVKVYLRDVQPSTRKKFIDLVKPIIKEYEVEKTDNV